MQAIRFVLQGEPASKANSRKIITHPVTGRPGVIKSQKARSYVGAALLQIPQAARLQLAGPVAVTARIYYASERPDLDESVILDVLQDQYTRIGGRRVLAQRGVYCNDRQVREKHIFHGIDKANPRAEIEVTALTWEQTEIAGA